MSAEPSNHGSATSLVSAMAESAHTHIGTSPKEEKQELLQKLRGKTLETAAAEKLADELEVTRVGKTLYGTEATGFTIPGRVVGGRTQHFRFSAVLSDEPALHSKWQIGESKIVKLLITRDRDQTFRRDNKPHFEWDLGPKSGPRDSQTKALVDHLASGGLLAALNVHERLHTYRQESEARLQVAERPVGNYGTAIETEPSLATLSHDDVAFKSLKNHWEQSYAKLDVMEGVSRGHSTQENGDPVEELRADLDSRLKRVLDERTHHRSHSFGHGH